MAIAKAAGKYKSGVKKRLPAGAFDCVQAALDSGMTRSEVAGMLGSTRTRWAT